MRVWRLFYWARLLVALFVVFIVATAALDVSLAPRVEPAQAAEPAAAETHSDVPEFEDIVHDSAADDVGGWLSTKIDDGLRTLEDLRLEVRELGGRVGDAVGL